MQQIFSSGSIDEVGHFAWIRSFHGFVNDLCIETAASSESSGASDASHISTAQEYSMHIWSDVLVWKGTSVCTSFQPKANASIRKCEIHGTYSVRHLCRF